MEIGCDFIHYDLIFLSKGTYILHTLYVHKLQVCIEIPLLLLTLLLQVKSQSLPVPPGKVKKFRCAFFNFSAEVGNQTGGWSYRGVNTYVINTSHVRCNASHLTSFVVLVSIVPSVGEPVSGNVWTANLDRKCMTALLRYMLIPT